VERIAGFYSDNATNYQVPEIPVTERDAIRAMSKDTFALAEMVCIPENIFEDGEWVILEWRDTRFAGVPSALLMGRLCSAGLLGQADVPKGPRPSANKGLRARHDGDAPDLCDPRKPESSEGLVCQVGCTRSVATVVSVSPGCTV
jgi:hypothetical protein